MGHNNSKIHTIEERLRRLSREGNLEELTILLAQYPELLNCRHPWTRLPLSFYTCVDYPPQQSHLNCLEFLVSQGCNLTDVEESRSSCYRIRQALFRGRSRFRASIIILLACWIYPVESIVCDYLFSLNIMEWTADYGL